MHHWSINPWKDVQGWGCCTEVPSLLSKCATPAQKEKSLLLLIKVMPINLKTWCHFISRRLFFKKNCKGRYGEMKSLYIAGGNIKWHRFHERQTLEWPQDPGSHHTSNVCSKSWKEGLDRHKQTNLPYYILHGLKSGRKIRTSRLNLATQWDQGQPGLCEIQMLGIQPIVLCVLPTEWHPHPCDHSFSKATWTSPFKDYSSEGEVKIL